MANLYATVDDVVTAAGIADPDDDIRLEAVLDAVSRQIDSWCHRSFFDSGSATARKFHADSGQVVRVDDFFTTTGLVVKTDDNDDGTYEITWASTEYQVEPLNGVVDGLTGWPYTRIRAINSRAFPSARRPLIEVTARWGWTAVPDPVREACIVQTLRLFKRKDSPFGVAGVAEFGVMRLHSKLDPDVEMLLAPYRKYAMAVS